MKTIRYIPVVLTLFISTLYFEGYSQMSILQNRTIENDRLVVSISFTGSAGILGMQGSFRFDSKSLRYHSIVVRNFPTLRLDDFSLENPSTLNLLWIDPQFQGIDLPENTPMFDIHFDILNNRNTDVYFTNCPLTIEVIDADDQVLSVSGDMVEDRFCTSVKGKVFQDINRNCSGSDEPGISGVFIEATGPAGKEVTVTDAQGNYEISGPTGQYSIRVFTPNALWAACSEVESVTVNSFSFPRTANFYLQSEFDCPTVEVKAGAAGLNLCTENELSFSYKNAGTLALTNPFVLIKMPPELELLQVSRPHTVEPDGSIKVSFNQLAPNEQGQFTIRVRTPCGSQWLDRSMCIEVRGNPDDVCLPPLQGWNGSNLRLFAECNNNIVRLMATNLGTSRMPTNIPLFVLKNDLQEKFENIRLDPGESYEFQKQGDGATYTILTYQVQGYPIQGAISASVEGCGSSNPSRGYINQFPFQKGESGFEKICLVLEDPEDYPPEKNAYVEGFGATHDVHFQTRMDYRINFTGALNNRVLIVDTLSNVFDLKTVRLNTSSHPVAFSMEPDRVLFFDVDLTGKPLGPLERGYVSFSVNYLPNLPLPFNSFNKAWIYKDNDQPVVTNIAEHKVIELYGDFASGFFESNTNSSKYISVYPNPVLNRIFTDQKKLPFTGPLLYKITDLTGRITSFGNVNNWNEGIPVSEYLQGFYFLEVQSTLTGEVYLSKFIKQ